MDKKLGHRVLEIRDRIVSNFDAGDWEEMGLLTGYSDAISGHSRLLRSLSWGDQDYGGNVLSVLRRIAEEDFDALGVIEAFLDLKYPEESHYLSAKPKAKKLTFAPDAFEVSDVRVEPRLVAVMMPFDAAFDPVNEAIKAAGSSAGFNVLRTDDIWEESTIIQDVFSLLLRAGVVVVDFTGRNSNVMYETGIAHTLGKLVIPISQSFDDVPFDVKHHRVLKYLANSEGLEALESKLTKKLGQVEA